MSLGPLFQEEFGRLEKIRVVAKGKLEIYWLCGMNNGISASCENVSSATLKSCRWDNIIHEMFLYIEKEKH